FPNMIPISEGEPDQILIYASLMFQVYIIDVTDGQHRWTVKHRYSDFYDLHEKLTAEKKVDRRLLPPKKILGKNSKSLVERRQKELELYLQTLLQQFPQATPTPLTNFLHFHLYEINGITAALAEELFHKGEQLLQAGEVFSLCPLQLFSVSQQLRMAKPTCCNGDAKTDLGHILDFTCRLRYLKISGTRGPVGTSNIQETSLPFDLSVFKSLLQIEITECSSQQIRGLSSLRSSLVTMSIHRSTESMMSILVPEASEFSQWEPEGVESGCPVTAVIPVWRNLTTLDMSHNCINSIDSSVKLMPKVEFLDLSYNQLSSVENLQHLYNLVHVDLSYNNLRVLEAAHTRLGNIKTLSLAGNQLDRLTGLTKLYSLVNLDLSHNQLAQLEEIRNIGSLPCLEKLNLSSNPICIIPDYRTKVLAQFGDRAAEVCLDCKATTEKELDTVEVLKAIQKAKEAKDRMSGSDKKVDSVTLRPTEGLSVRLCIIFRNRNMPSFFQVDPGLSNTCQLLPRSLINSWELEESQGAQGGYPVLFMPSSSSSALNTHPLLSDILSEEPSLPSLLFLTHRQLWVLKMDFRELSEIENPNAGLRRLSSSSSFCRLVRVPLGSVVLHPRERDAQVGDKVTESLHFNHTLMWLTEEKHVELCHCPDIYGPKCSCSCCLFLFFHSWDSSRLHMEENQPSPHLIPGLSPGLKLMAGLGEKQLLTYFHRYIAQSEAEEVRQVLWLSVILYKSPEAELTCCLLLSTDSIYFLLEDSAATLGHHSGKIYSYTCLCCCMSIRLSDLLAVNVGLFDQYFRVVGHSADHVVCCLSRDSYGTSVFLQELMSALSLQQQLPPPEPSDQDFYSQFTNTSTGKMQNYELVHSSKVKFIYPSEEEMGDLTFIVAERKTPASVATSSPCSFNVLLYLLVFQVRILLRETIKSSLPRTLILTSTDVFLLDEDYVSYPLPDFAKEPPSRERYQLREARRIRDLDRVLLGYQTYPQALTLVFDDLPGPDLLCHLTMDHFAVSGNEAHPRGGVASRGAEGEVQWCIFVPGADSRERLISLLARQWEVLCSRELPVELTG
uniref:Nischarin n=1 Tax=Oreochromis niloticus TaxID=8128 RepID=I3IVE1_ORENI